MSEGAYNPDDETPESLVSHQDSASASPTYASRTSVASTAPLRPTQTVPGSSANGLDLSGSNDAITATARTQQTALTISLSSSEAEAGPSQPSFAEPLPSSADGASNETQRAISEWRSWKIQWPFLLLVFFTVSAFFFSITSLLIISQEYSGFARESRPPAFLEQHPKLQKAIWEQGILYTAFPAFIMTVYRGMWDSSVMAIADRQPYVDLQRGGHPRTTILLDYKAVPVLYRWFSAIRNRHLLLSACLLSSLIISFAIVPLTSFLFTMDTSLFNETLPLSFDSVYDLRILLPKNPFLQPSADVRLALDSAAGVHLQNSSLPPWTDGLYAFPKFSPQKETGNGNYSVESFATSAHVACEAIPESKYQRTITPVPGSEDGYLVKIQADDRGCAISHALAINTGLWSPAVALTSWHTQPCSITTGISRISLLAAINNKRSQKIENITLVSCQLFYFETSGQVTTQSSLLSASPSIVVFEPKRSNSTSNQWPYLPLKSYFESQLNAFDCVDTVTNIRGNELAKYSYRIANRISPEEPLGPDTLSTAAEMLLRTTYAIFAATNLFRPLQAPVNSSGTYLVEEKRLFVVPQIAYIILAVLFVTMILNASLFVYSRQKSILIEEPYSLLSAAGILHNSDLNSIMEEIVQNGRTSRRARETAEQLYKRTDIKCFFDDANEKITLDPLELCDSSAQT